MPKQSEEWSIAQQHFMDGYNTAIKELEHLGWHPTSELPPEEDEYIVISDEGEWSDLFYAEFKRTKGWCSEIEGHYTKINVKWWCYPPKED